MSKEKIKVYLYTRVSTTMQIDGYSLDAQKTKMKASEKHYRRIDEVAPKTGVVRLLRLTEKQYNNIYMVTGEADYQEKTVGINCHIVI